MTVPAYRTQRLLDWAVLAAAAIPAGLIGAVAAVAIKRGSPGPIFFKQERIGLDGAPFACFKFRTMVDGDNPLMPDQGLITSAGHWLRRFSLDELPQLINVARGEMSIVGPRPMPGSMVERCGERQKGRHRVRPGLTGLAQISGRNSLTWEERIELDLEYTERRSLRIDLRILARTAQALVSGDGVVGHPVSDLFVLDNDTYRLVVDMTERRNGGPRDRRKGGDRRVRDVPVAADRRAGNRRQGDRRDRAPEIRIRRAERQSPVDA